MTSKSSVILWGVLSALMVSATEEDNENFQLVDKHGHDYLLRTYGKGIVQQNAISAAQNACIDHSWMKYFSEIKGELPSVKGVLGSTCHKFFQGGLTFKATVFQLSEGFDSKYVNCFTKQLNLSCGEPGSLISNEKIAVMTLAALLALYAFRKEIFLAAYRKIVINKSANDTDRRYEKIKESVNGMIEQSKGRAKILKSLESFNQDLNDFYETYKCPIGLNIMMQPVSLNTGVTFDLENITRWLKFSKTCPESGKPITEDITKIDENRIIKSEIQAKLSILEDRLIIQEELFIKNKPRVYNLRH